MKTVFKTYFPVFYFCLLTIIISSCAYKPGLPAPKAKYIPVDPSAYNMPQIDAKKQYGPILEKVLSKTTGVHEDHFDKYWRYLSFEGAREFLNGKGVILIYRYNEPDMGIFDKTLTHKTWYTITTTSENFILTAIYYPSYNPYPQHNVYFFDEKWAVHITNARFCDGYGDIPDVTDNSWAVDILIRA